MSLRSKAATYLHIACFKGAGHALSAAVKIDEAHKDEIPSTKGLLV